VELYKQNGKENIQKKRSYDNIINNKQQCKIIAREDEKNLNSGKNFVLTWQPAMY